MQANWGTYLPEEIGWPELVREVARIRDALPLQDRLQLGILGTNYGEAGAVNLYGPGYGLPRAISGVNSFWYRGYPDPPPQVLIAAMAHKLARVTWAVLSSGERHRPAAVAV